MDEKAPEDPRPMTAVEAHRRIAEARQFLREHRDQRLAEARADLDALLARHGVALFIDIVPVEELQSRGQR